MNQRVLAALEELAAALADDAVGPLRGDDSLLGETQALGLMVDRIEAALSERLAVIDLCQLSVAQMGMNTATWFSHVARVPRSRCNQLLSVGRSTNSALKGAVGRCELSTQQAAVIARATNARNVELMEAVTGQLVALGSVASSFEHFTSLVADVANRADVDGVEPRAEDSRCYVKRVADSVVLKATLYGEHANVVEWVLNDAANEIYSSYDQVADHRPRRAALVAHALSQCCSRSRIVAKGAGPKTQALVVIDTNNPQANSALLCEADLEVLTTAGEVPIKLQRLKRFPTASQRRALVHRDGSCVFPGCRTAGHMVDIHHGGPWSQGGATDIDQMACLCRTHHSITHSRGWHMTTTPDGFRWTTPNGTTLLSQRRGVIAKPLP